MEAGLPPPPVTGTVCELHDSPSKEGIQLSRGFEAPLASVGGRKQPHPTFTHLPTFKHSHSECPLAGAP
jgi:hypothetical protein